MAQVKINMDLTVPVVVKTEEQPWIKSPAAGIERRPLEREEAESGRTSSVVRYAPGSSFPAHVHTGGEEFLVLDGVFSDEYGDYSAGTYVRNPPMTKHTPFSRTGCIIFVKLCQYQEGDQKQFVENILEGEWENITSPDISIRQLHRYKDEVIQIERWNEMTSSSALENPGGQEVFILEGALQDKDYLYEKGTWIRTPAGETIGSRYSGTGCLLYVKQGHLV